MRGSAGMITISTPFDDPESAAVPGRVIIAHPVRCRRFRPAVGRVVRGSRCPDGLLELLARVREGRAVGRPASHDWLAGRAARCEVGCSDHRHWYVWNRNSHCPFCPWARSEQTRQLAVERGQAGTRRVDHRAQILGNRHHLRLGYVQIPN